jgi:hypothetical protein
VRDPTERFAIVIAYGVTVFVDQVPEAIRPLVLGVLDDAPQEVAVMTRGHDVIIIQIRDVIRFYQPRDTAKNTMTVPATSPNVFGQGEFHHGVAILILGQNHVYLGLVFLPVYDDPVLDVGERGTLNALNALIQEGTSQSGRDYGDLGDLKNPAMVVDKVVHDATVVNGV